MSLADSTTNPRHDYFQRTPGVEIRVLRKHPDGGLTFLTRMAKGARSERHGHPGGEETYMVSGTLCIENRVAANGEPQPSATISAGDHFYAPAGEIHEGVAQDEATCFYVVAPGGIASAHSK